MNAEKLFIPEKLKVGFQDRKGTYTGKLAFVVYYDKKGVLRKQKSWESWRDQSIQALDFENVPTDGFVLNKGVGGARESWGWNARNEYIRIYDPRGFEFEISVPNLLFILKEVDCSRGKGLEGKFVYAWDRDSLVLLPVNSQEYKVSANFTELQDKSVKAKELVAGAFYLTKQQKSLVYLGKFPVYDHGNFSKYTQENKKGKNPENKFVFFDSKENDFVFLKELKSIAVRVGDLTAPNFAELVDKYNNSQYATTAIELFTKKADKEINVWAVKFRHQGNNTAYQLYISHQDYYHKDIDYIHRCGLVYIENGIVIYNLSNNSYEFIYNPNSKRMQEQMGKSRSPAFHSLYGWTEASYAQNTKNWMEPNNQELWVRLANGQEFRVGYGKLEKGNQDGQD